MTVEVAGEDTVPLLLRELPWVRSGCVAYRVVWDPPDLVDANREVPPHTHLVARKRSSELVARVSRALWDAAGGEIADESDFLVDPEDL